MQGCSIPHVMLVSPECVSGVSWLENVNHWTQTPHPWGKHTPSLCESSYYELPWSHMHTHTHTHTHTQKVRATKWEHNTTKTVINSRLCCYFKIRFGRQTEKLALGSGEGGFTLMNNCVDVAVSCFTASPVMYSYSFIQQESHLLCCHRGQKCVWSASPKRSSCKYEQYAKNKICCVVNKDSEVH